MFRYKFYIDFEQTEKKIFTSSPLPILRLSFVNGEALLEWLFVFMGNK
jgi:hypothetical protein